jgi:protein subunit release factor B
MHQLGIHENDIEEKFIRSGGHGGQNVNKTSTCVYLKHLPSGLEVKCQIERSQVLNRFLARRMLLDKVEAKQRGEQSAREQKFEKLRRQKRRRSRRSKLKMLEDKRLQGIKKSLRAAVKSWE